MLRYGLATHRSIFKFHFSHVLFFTLRFRQASQQQLLPSLELGPAAADCQQSRPGCWAAESHLSGYCHEGKCEGGGHGQREALSQQIVRPPSIWG